MRNKLLLIMAALTALIAYGCGNFHTRVEQDLYAVSLIDTTDKYIAQNAPENRDNGVIYPSSRRFESIRTIVTKDSLVERFYPNFIRVGVFESVGLLFGGDSKYAMGTGMFGIFPEFSESMFNKGEKDYLFTGGMYKFFFLERRLRWFQDAANWTWGFTAMEIIAPDSRSEKALMSPTFNLRKRYYLKETIPYISLSPGISFGIYPSQFVNLNGCIEVGSIGGFNLRAYLGFAAGSTVNNSNNLLNNDTAGKAETSIFPYAGIGVSFLDFHNLVPETLEEWKDYDYSSFDVSLIESGILMTNSDYSLYDTSKTILNGAYLKLLSANVAIPILNNNFFIGSSLINLIAVGKGQWGMGILPLRIGYFQTILPDELTTAPFFEINYYPTSFIQIGNKLNLKLHKYLNLNVLLGYASGSGNDDLVGLDSDLNKNFGPSADWSGAYLGIGISVGQVFLPSELRYNK